MSQETAIQTHNLIKTFDKVVAVDKVSFDVRQGEILALLGENGSGKTTLVNMLFGIYFPDSGEIKVGEYVETIRSPKDAKELGIGMVHQHFKLVETFSAADNIVLGLKGKFILDRKSYINDIRQISERYGFGLNPEEKIYNMSVSQKQTVEIVKVLYRGAEILILDEPTAVLTPQESEQLFVTLRKMKEDGKAIVIITHKLHEVMSVSDRVHVLRKGKTVGVVETSQTNQQELTEMMVGRAISLKIDRPEFENKTNRLRVENLSCISHDGVKTLQDINFTLNAGEILGVAGVAGSGQKELCESLAGLYPVADGSVELIDEDGAVTQLVGKTTSEIRKIGLKMAFVPEDRLGMGLVADMDMIDNVMLRGYDAGRSPFADRKRARSLATGLVEKLSIVTPGVNKAVRRMSGGNVQKVLLGREISSEPKVLIVAYPVRGLDINSSYTIFDLLNKQKQEGVAILYVGEDLDVLLELSDRILVLCGGQVSGIVDATTATKDEVGLLMMQVPTAISPCDNEGVNKK